MALQVVDISDPTNPQFTSLIDPKNDGFATSSITSVSVSNGIIAIALPDATDTNNGKVLFYSTNGAFLTSADVGPLPDMVTFDATGDYILTANEGQSAGGDNEPNVAPNPNGSVSIIDISGGVNTATVTTLDFSDASITFAALLAKGVRTDETAPSAAADLEPEYITIEGNKAFITLQENNAVAVIDDITAPTAFTIDDILPMGTKDHSAAGNGLDPSNRDDGINIDPHPVQGLYMPDAIASYEVGGVTYYVTANEGDGRDVDEARGADLVDGDLSNGEVDAGLDAQLLADLADNEELGRLKFSTIDGDTDGDGDIDVLHSFGGRSFSIYDENGNQVFDSGDNIAQVTAALVPTLFNSDDSDPSEFDDRSDDKGAEPEGVTVGVIDGQTYAFVGLERTGGVMVYDITDPSDVSFVTYATNPGDAAPEGLTFISAADSPNSTDILAVTNEESSTLTLFSAAVPTAPDMPTLQITEMWPGQSGTDITEDWFEITNTGDVAWISGTSPDLYYDDDSADPTKADPVLGLTRLDPGETAIVVVGDAADATTFRTVWSGDVDLSNVEVGHTDGAGLSGGGDAVTLWLGDPQAGGVLVDSEAYPDTDSNDGQSYDVDLAAFSTVNNASGAVASTTLGGDGGDVAAIASPGSLAETNFTLELLHFTDQEAGSKAVIDAPNLSAVLNALRAEDLGNDGVVDNTITLSSGDAFIPGLFYDASAAAFGSAGIADIQIQNELGVQAIALGNHEFDFGTGELAGLIDGSATGDFSNPLLDGTALDDADFGGTDMPYLSTNLDFSADANMAGLEVAGGQAPQGNVVTSSTVIDTNGENIGVVGATTPTLGSISSPGSVGISPTWAGTTPTDAELDALAADIQTEVDALLASNPDMNKVVLLAHMQQISIEQALASRLTDVDVIVAGGSNTRLFDDNDRVRDGDSDQGQYPQFITNAGGTQTALVNTDGSYKYVGRLVIDFDKDGNIIADSYDETVSGAYATDAQGVADLNAGALIDPEIQALADAIEEQIILTESNVFGFSNVFLNGNRSGVDASDDPDGVRTQETNLGNLTADANLAAAKESDAQTLISIKNGGGIRASIGETIVPAGGSEYVRVANQEVVDGDGNVIKAAGGISQNDIQTTLAFNNGLTLLTLTGAELLAVLEHGVSSVPGVSGRFPQVSGIQFSYDEDSPEGSRIENIALFDLNAGTTTPLYVDGAFVGAGETELFRIVTLDFLASPRFDDLGNFTGGGDGYPFPNTNTDPAEGELGDPAIVARVNITRLEQDGTQTGDATFADDGTEQDALAEYLNDNFGTQGTAFSQSDAGPESDLRIQSLNDRTDTINPDTGTGGGGAGGGGAGGGTGDGGTVPDPDAGQTPATPGTDGDDTITFETFDAAQSFDGGEGYDTVTIPGNIDDFTFEAINGGFRVTPANGEPIDLNSVEKLVFGDKTIGISTDTATINLHLLYETIMNRGSDFDGLAFWDDQSKAGMSIFDISDFFVGSQEFKDKFGENLTNEQIVDLAYQHVLGRNADEAGRAFWVNNMNDGNFDFGDVFAHFATSAEVKNLFENQIDDGVLLTI